MVVIVFCDLTPPVVYGSVVLHNQDSVCIPLHHHGVMEEMWKYMRLSPGCNPANPGLHIVLECKLKHSDGIITHPILTFNKIGFVAQASQGYIFPRDFMRHLIHC